MEQSMIQQKDHHQHSDLFIEGFASKKETSLKGPITLMTKEMETPVNLNKKAGSYAPLQRRAFTVQQQFQFEVEKDHLRFSDNRAHLLQMLSESSSSSDDEKK